MLPKTGGLPPWKKAEGRGGGEEGKYEKDEDGETGGGGGEKIDGEGEGGGECKRMKRR